MIDEYQSTPQTAYEIDPATDSVIGSKTLSSPWLPIDWTYANGYMWGIDGTTLYQADHGDDVQLRFAHDGLMRLYDAPNAGFHELVFRAEQASVA